jgi:hypothetical protein
MYSVKFASVREASDPRILMAGFSSGSTITGTVAGEVEQLVVQRDRFGAPQARAKVKLPLLLHPVYHLAETNQGKN